MVLFLAALLVLICWGISFSGTGSFNEAYLDRKNTAAINGIFVILVVFSHYSQYSGLGDILDAPYLMLKKHLLQMVVATFLFYSGYGMMEQIHKRGAAYVRAIPKRAGKLLFRFGAAVLMFVALKAMLGKTYSLKRIALSLIGWKSVGNSNWYIFDILVLYVLMFAAFSIGGLLSSRSKPGLEGRSQPDHGRIGAFSSKHPDLPGLIIFFVLTLAFVYVMMKAHKGSRWYNTVILFPVGSFYSEFRGEIERLVRRNDVSYYLTLLIMVPVYFFTYRHRSSFGIEGYTVWAVAFIGLLILLTMKVCVYNRILEWFGRHVFSIYILQRIPMILLDHCGLIDAHKYLCLIAVFALTIPLALAFEKVTDAVLSLPAKGTA